jgi:pimeloyl-ACP methyl ester carboxylesterase
MAGTFDTSILDVSGLRTRHLVRGSGPPVLVLHGWGACIEAVAPIVSALEPLARVHALDLPGFGESALPPMPWGVEEYQEFVAAFMDALRLERASIVAHSNGGRIAIRMAASEPQRIDKLVLVDSAGIRPRRTLRWYRRVALAKIGKHAARLLGTPGEWLRERLVSKAASADYLAAGAMRPTLVRLVNADLRPQLPQISASTLLIWGAEDTETPPSDGQLMERLIPDAGLVVLEGAGHYSYLDQQARFGAIVRHFLAAKPAEGAPSRSGGVMGRAGEDAVGGAWEDAVGGAGEDTVSSAGEDAVGSG